MTPPAIVISGHTMGLGVVRALAQMGVPVVMLHHDPRDMAHVSKYIDKALRVPHPEHNAAEFLAQLIKLAPRYAGSPLMPTSDEALAVLSRNKTALEQHYIVACPDWDVTQRVIEKTLTYVAAEEAGVAIPKSIAVNSLEEAETEGRALQFPVLIKPSQGHLFLDRFKQKMFHARDFDDMVAQFRQLEGTGLEVVLQEIIPGDDTCGINYNSYFWDGQPLVEFTARQLRNAPPMFGSPRVAISEKIPGVLESGRKILQALGYYGFSCTEFKQDPRDGSFKLMEVNGRHNLSSLLAVRCGMNFPWLEYDHLVNGHLPDVQDFQTGVYWIDILRDLGYSVRNWRSEDISLRGYLTPYRKPHVFAIFDRRDPRPFFKRAGFLGRGALSKVTPRRHHPSTSSPQHISPAP